MSHGFTDIAFTAAVIAEQEAQGSRARYADFGAGEAAENTTLTDAEVRFLSVRDSFYMATVNSDGWPYIQHRGGPPGFVKVLNETQIGFAEFMGNRQYVSLGNLRGDARVSMFFMDYANKARLKLLGRIQMVEAADPRLERLLVPNYRARVERGLIVDIAGFDWNCPQHIAERYTLEEVRGAFAKMQTSAPE